MVPSRPQVPLLLRCALAAPLAVALACTGSVADSGAAAAVPSTPPVRPGPGSGGAPPKGSGPTAPDVPPREPLAACPAGGPATPGALQLRRLTNGEYDRTVNDLFSRKGLAVVTAEFPADPEVDGFTNNADALGLGSTHAEKYRDAAERLSWEVASSDAKRMALVGCETSGPDGVACLRGFIAKLGRRVFRRPLGESEIAGYLKLAAGGAADPMPHTDVALVIQAMLQSPHFLFRVELGTADPKRPGLRRLDGYELATRLSYLVLRSTPSEALLDAAAKGALDTPEGLAAKAKELLAGPNAPDGLKAYASQWLRLGHLAGTTPDPKVVPKLDEGLRSSMSSETSMFVEDILWNGNALDLLTAKQSFLDPTLETHYGVKVPDRPKEPSAQKSFLRYSFGNQPKAGILTQAALLTINGREEGVAPILRGKFVREVLLCDPPPPPPDDVPPLEPQKGSESVRERLAAHRTNGVCAGCHSRMDPVGFGLEQFDLLGRYRTKDPAGNLLTGQGNLQGFDKPDFVGPQELGERLRGSPAFPGCLVTHLYRYAFGRSETDADACGIAAATGAFRDAGHSFKALLLSLVVSDDFRYGTTPETTP